MIKGKKGGIIYSSAWLIVYFCILVVAALAIGFQNNPNMDVSSFDNLKWKDIHPTQDVSQIEDNVPRIIINTTYNGINLFGQTLMPLMGEAAHYANNHKEQNWKLISFGVMLAILAPIIYYTIQLIILFAVLINEWRHRREDKKCLDELKGRKKET